MAAYEYAYSYVMDVGEMLRLLEEKLLQTSIRKNAEAISSMLSEEFREFGSSGRIFSRADVIRLLQAELPSSITMTGWHVRMLTGQIALATYRAIKRDPEGLAIESLRSSIWVYQADRWQMLFNQGTKVPAR